MLAPQPPHKLTLEQWLPTAEEGTELIDGVPDDLRIQAATARHGDVCSNVLVALRTALQHAGSPCRASVASPRVWINEAESYVTDVFVECPEQRSLGLEQHPTLESDQYVWPDIVVEVLSPSTGYRDQTEKLDGHTQVSSVRHYLVIDPERNRLWHYHRMQAREEFEVVLGSTASTLKMGAVDVLAAEFF